MHHFYISPTDISETKATLTGDDARHLQQVLRIKKGEIIGLFDGAGTTYTARVEDIKKSAVHTVILQTQKNSRKPPYVSIAQCVVKKKNMDLIVQKSTELGIHSFLPVISQNCSLTYRPSTQECRWQKIALEACKQCGQPFTPQIERTCTLVDLLSNCQEYDTKILLWENESKLGIKPFCRKNPPNSILLLVGPEGGFTLEEVTMAVSSGWTSASLGTLTLRAETAAIAALSITQYLLETA